MSRAPETTAIALAPAEPIGSLLRKHGVAREPASQQLEDQLVRPAVAFLAHCIRIDASAKLGAQLQQQRPGLSRDLCRRAVIVRHSFVLSRPWRSTSRR